MKPIRMTDQEIETAISQFRSDLTKLKTADGNISYTAYLSTKTPPEERPKLFIANCAYMQMRYLLETYSGEVGWFGRVVRDTYHNSYTVTDLLVYPQEVTGSTVTTDEKQLEDWYNNLNDDQFNAKRFHGHSHVNFAPFASSTDIQDREGKLKDLTEDDFFIFMIINKKLEFSVEIYDLAANRHYETADVDVIFPDLTAQFFESLAQVKQKSHAAQEFGSEMYTVKYNKDSGYDKQTWTGPWYTEGRDYGSFDKSL